MEGSHSLFGLLGQIASARGWSLHYILWKVDYQVLRLMLLDQPRYISKEEAERTPLPEGVSRGGSDDGSDIVAQFEAQLKQLGYQ